MKNGVCYIVSAGDMARALPDFSPDDYIIACDAGIKYLDAAHIAPDVFVGDGDSLGYIPEAKETFVLPVVKDDTDTAAAVKLALSRGFKKIVLLGALGGERFSHTVANVALLSYIKKCGADGVIDGGACRVRILAEGESLSIPGTRGYFSLFAEGGEAEVSISGAKYSGEKIKLEGTFPLGVSNEPGEDCRVRVTAGSVLLIDETY